MSGADGQDRGLGWRRHRQCEGVGHEASRAAQRHRTAAHHAHHGVVGAGVNLAIVDQEAVGDSAQARERVAVVARDRLFRAVAAGHHQPGWAAPQQEILQRRRRQEHAQLREPGRDAGGQRPAPRRGEHDRSRGRGERVAGDIVEGRDLFQRCERARHHRERLRRSVLARAQSRDRIRIARVDGEQEAAGAFDGDDLTGRERGDRAAERAFTV